MSSEHLRAIREYEVTQVISYLHPNQLILEIGPGMGWQSKFMTQLGLKVITLDTPENKNGIQQIFYDGKNIPLQNASVDLVYTSNVLEHIIHVVDFQKELHRVLKPDGRAIHILPSGSWRWWTSLAFYVRKLQGLPRKFHRRKLTSQVSPTLQRHRHLLFPERHGVSGNSLTELYTFSPFYWIRFFRTTDWTIERVRPTYLFYTGYSILDSRLSLRFRHYLSYIAGSACLIYVLR
jgi:SAM-dependent methyltransferase